MNVACEACHGPGSRHVEWANAPRWLRSMRWDDNGLPVHLTERRGVSWVIDLDTLVPARSQPRTTSVEIDTCAPCHARREQIAEGYVPGGVLRDHYVPDPITPDLYYADGQQREEVYTWGSFLQSRMAHAGVTCSDCHDPHAGRPRMSGNLLCAPCHVPAKYDTDTHHGHAAGSTGAQCVACHMPSTTYMQVDARRDHSIRVPRPDRTQRLGVPNPCSTCHADRGAGWAAEQVRKWHGREPGGFQTFADVFHAAETGGPGADEALARIADDQAQPALIRASALGRLGERPGPAAQQAAVRNLADADAGVRLAALGVFDAFDPAQRAGFVAPLLDDPVRAVRLRAAWLLAPVANALTGTDQGRAFAKAADEFIASRRLMADRPEARTTLGVFLTALGRRDEAKAEYEAALRLAPRYTPARINLSDLYREDGREQDAARVLRAGLDLAPEDAALHHALGLSLVRQGRRAEAVAALKRAADLAPEDAASRFAYAYAVALHGEGRVAEALGTLERALARDPDDEDVLFALVTFHRDAGRTDRALEYARRMQEAHPGDPRARALVESLER
ncbi:MAG TPA: tetratricopeptide repeat protein [Vicinamibacterales bacterium]